MRLTCGRGEYELYIGHFELDRSTNLLELKDMSREYQYLIRGTPGLFGSAGGTHVAVSTMWIPTAALQVLYPRGRREPPRIAGPLLPCATAMLTPWYHRTPHASRIKPDSTSGEYSRYLKAMLCELEDYMFASYLQVVDAAIHRPGLLQHGTRKWRRHGAPYVDIVSNISLVHRYVIKPYAPGLVTKLLLESTERYAIAASLAAGNKWMPS
jgi:hypothetical protein